MDIKHILWYENELSIREHAYSQQCKIKQSVRQPQCK